jgi:outer membrane receptor protein involved in Fe transport
MKSLCFALTAIYSALSAAQQATVVLPTVTIQGQRQPAISAESPSGIGNATRIELEDKAEQPRSLDQSLVDEGAAAWDAANALGIANGLSVRGFVVNNQGVSTLQVGRNFLNGHADLVWRFARDPATVSRVELISGSDATLLGAGSPAASVLFTTKSPSGIQARKFGLVLGTSGLKRLTGDAEFHWGPVQTRAVIALQRDDKSVEDVQDERNVVLVSNKLPVGAGAIKLDVEYHQNKTPFPFGTAYVGGRFVYDQPFVDSRAFANRQYRRQALYFDHPLGDATQISLYWQRGHSTRNELLLGFFDPLNTTKLRGYYRTVDENNSQSDLGVKLNGRFNTGALAHDWTATWQHLDLARDFAGPQNIGGFTLDATNPVFPVNLQSLPLSTRYAFERYRERGVAVADVMNIGDWEARLALRRSAYQLSSSTTLTGPVVPVAEASHTSSSVALGKRLTDTQRLWVSRTESFLPNRGRFSSGAFLPPSVSHQYELGWQYKKSKQAFSFAVFDLEQSNLPARDPADPDALVLIGSNRSKGFEAKADFQWAGVQWQGALTRLQARVQDRISATQGSFLVGSPDGYGSLKASLPVGAGITTWARWQGATSRPGDDKASFRSPGYGILGVGLEAAATPGGTRWGTNIQNLADKRYVRSLTGADNVWQGPRRSLQVWADTAF